MSRARRQLSRGDLRKTDGPKNETRNRWHKNTVHMTDNDNVALSDPEMLACADGRESELVETAEGAEQRTRCIHGFTREQKQSTVQHLKLAKQRSYCSACNRRFTGTRIPNATGP